MNEDVINEVLSFVPFDLLDGLEDEARLKELTRWFNKDFFKWAKDIPCHNCKSPTQPMGATNKVTIEEAENLAGNVELYKCTSCGAMTRFPRYNKTTKLLQTRIGRCGEWANCFHAFLVALGFTARFVNDWTDHVWVEVWLDSCQSYVHVDPCENLVNRPLVYEEGWGKKLKWIVAFNQYECVDVTKRYTNKYDEVINRRQAEIPESLVQKIIAYKNSEFLALADEETKNEVLKKQRLDLDVLNKRKVTITPEEERPRISGS